MEFDLPSDRGRTGVSVPPAMALAIATIVAAGVTGLAVAGLTWTLDRPAEQVTGAPPDLSAFDPAPSPSSTGPIDTPGLNEAMGMLPAPAPVPSAATAVEGVGTVAAPAAVPGQEETARRAAAARRPVVGPTASVRSTPTAITAAPGTALAGAPASGVSAPGVSAPGVSAPGVSAPGVSAPGVSAPGVSAPAVSAPGASATTVPPTFAEPDPGSAAGAAGAAGADDSDVEPTATETTAPQRRWEPPRRQWRDEPRQAPAPQWGGPFGDFPRMFPWR